MSRLTEKGELMTDREKTTEMTWEEFTDMMSEGNPGAMSFIYSLTSEIGIDAISPLFRCDSIGLHGDKLYMFWNDCCGRDTWKALRALEVYQPDEILAAIEPDERGRGRILEV